MPLHHAQLQWHQGWVTLPAEGRQKGHRCCRIAAVTLRPRLNTNRPLLLLQFWTAVAAVVLVTQYLLQQEEWHSMNYGSLEVVHAVLQQLQRPPHSSSKTPEVQVHHANQATAFPQKHDMVCPPLPKSHAILVMLTTIWQRSFYRLFVLMASTSGICLPAIERLPFRWIRISVVSLHWWGANISRNFSKPWYQSKGSLSASRGLTLH
mmetsp:Transcript_25926/g.49668  ORF Transcript_25926/g.49668 Transcript_25926/m.49668 type:complete len:207 (+) Transcript_25926:216-836(+)